MTPPPGGPPRLPGARELPRDLTIESRPLVPLEGGRLVDPLAPGPLGLSGGAADLARLGETSLPPPPPGAGLMPGVLNPPDASALALACYCRGRCPLHMQLHIAKTVLRANISRSLGDFEIAVFDFPF